MHSGRKENDDSAAELSQREAQPPARGIELQIFDAAQ